jgi:hypothetical protein
MMATIYFDLIAAANSKYFIAGPAEQESGADWRAVAELEPAEVQRLFAANYFVN